VRAREQGRLTPGRAERRPMVIDPFLPQVEEWVDRSKGKIRAGVAHDKLVALGFTGSERTTRRAVAEVKAAYRAGRRRVHRPWVPEPRCGGEQAVARRRNQAYIDGHRLAERRKNAWPNTDWVAERMGVTKSRVSQIERGEVSTVEAIARYVQGYLDHPSDRVDNRPTRGHTGSHSAYQSANDS
jgi:hypothetical protein